MKSNIVRISIFFLLIGGIFVFSNESFASTLVAQSYLDNQIIGYNLNNDYPIFSSTVVASSSGVASRVDFYIGNASAGVAKIVWSVQDLTDNSAYFGNTCSDQSDITFPASLIHQINSTNLHAFTGLNIVSGHTYRFTVLGANSGCSYFTPANSQNFSSYGQGTSSIAFKVVSSTGDEVLGNINTTSRVIFSSLTPQHLATTSSPVSFSFDYYINSSDVLDLQNPPNPPLTFHNYYPKICVDVYSISGFIVTRKQMCNDVVLDFLETFASSTSLANGGYYQEIYLYNPVDNSRKGLYFDTGSIALETFAVSAYNTIDQDNSFASGTPPIFDSTAFSASCNPISNNISTLYLNPSFSILDCTYFFLLPNPTLISQNFNAFKSIVLTSFPIGYITDFVNIISTSSTSSLPVINATIPTVLPAGGSHITLSLTHVLDPFLNATTSIYTNESASSTETMFQITNRYWSYLVYMLAFLYMVGRIVGGHLISGRHNIKTK